MKSKGLIRACLSTDEFASAMTTQEEEYEGIETFLRETLPTRDFLFTRNVNPTLVKHKPMELYLFDFGGLCRVDLFGRQREDFCGQILSAAKDRPNVLFIPWTAMTLQFWRFVVEEFFPELMSEPNVWLPEPMKLWEEMGNESLQNKLKEWFA